MKIFQATPRLSVLSLSLIGIILVAGCVGDNLVEPTTTTQKILTPTSTTTQITTTIQAATTTLPTETTTTTAAATTATTVATTTTTILNSGTTTAATTTAATTTTTLSQAKYTIKAIYATNYTPDNPPYTYGGTKDLFTSSRRPYFTFSILNESVGNVGGFISLGLEVIGLNNGQKYTFKGALYSTPAEKLTNFTLDDDRHTNNYNFTGGDYRLRIDITHTTSEGYSKIVASYVTMENSMPIPLKDKTWSYFFS